MHKDTDTKTVLRMLRSLLLAKVEVPVKGINDAGQALDPRAINYLAGRKDGIHEAVCAINDALGED